MSLKVKLENKDGIIEKKKGLDVNKGVCVFPFVHKDVEYNECFKGAKGNWCATEVNPKTNKIRKWAYCDPDPKVTHMCREAVWADCSLGNHNQDKPKTEHCANSDTYPERG